MKIQQFSQLGKRGNNEDSLGRNEALLTVCDGMGGHNYGERASAFVVEHLLEAFAELQPLGKTEIQQQLTKVQTNLNGLLEKEPELERMGTTFTGIFRTPDVWYAAHIGDSRIYLFRPAERKLWHTWDHSLVGDLMRTKEITVEAGRFHPLSNRISKAIIAQTEGKTAMASIVKIDELKAGDILLLCSDGVVESWGDWDLVQLFADEKMSFEQKCQKLAQQCDGNSKDNNTAIIAEIEAADAFSYGSNDELDWTTFDEVEADYKQYLADCGKEEPELEADAVTANAPAAAPKKATPAPPVAPKKPVSPKTTGKKSEQKKPKRKLWLILALVLVVAGVVAFFALQQTDSDDDSSDTKSRTERNANKDKEKKSEKKGEPAKGSNANKGKDTPDNLKPEKTPKEPPLTSVFSTNHEKNSNSSTDNGSTKNADNTKNTDNTGTPNANKDQKTSNTNPK